MSCPQKTKHHDLSTTLRWSYLPGLDYFISFLVFLNTSSTHCFVLSPTLPTRFAVFFILCPLVFSPFRPDAIKKSDLNLADCDFEHSTTTRGQLFDLSSSKNCFTKAEHVPSPTTSSEAKTSPPSLFEEPRTWWLWSPLAHPSSGPEGGKQPEWLGGRDCFPLFPSLLPRHYLAWLCLVIQNGVCGELWYNLQFTSGLTWN